MRNLKNISHAIFAGAASAVLLACGGGDTNTAKEPPVKDFTSTEAAKPAFKMSEADIAAIEAMDAIELLETAAVQSNKLADVLATVKDEASAQAAAVEIANLEPILNTVGKGLENLDANGMALSTGILTPMQSFAESQARIFNEASRIAADHPELQSIIAKGLENIDRNFQ